MHILQNVHQYLPLQWLLPINDQLVPKTTNSLLQPYAGVVSNVDFTFPGPDFPTHESLVPDIDNLDDPLCLDEIGSNYVNAETDVTPLTVIWNKKELVLEPDVLVSSSTPLTKSVETLPKWKKID